MKSLHDTQEENLLHILKQKLEEKGFKYVSKGRYFQKDDGDCLQEIHLTRITHKLNHKESFSMDIDFAMLNKQIENVLDQFKKEATLNEKHLNSITSWFGGRLEKMWEIYPDANIEEIVLEMYEIIEKDIFPFFEKYKSVENILEKISNYVVTDHDFVHLGRGPFIYLVSAFLLKQKDQFEKAYEKHKDKIKILNADRTEEFRKLYDYLSKKWLPL